VKLPYWFKIETPVGTYNPDWAIVKEEDSKDQTLYLVRETKGARDVEQLRKTEDEKIECAKKHFQELNIDFKTVNSPSEI